MLLLAASSADAPPGLPQTASILQAFFASQLSADQGPPQASVLATEATPALESDSALARRKPRPTAHLLDLLFTGEDWQTELARPTNS